jgi:hypothetical protein
LAGIENTAVGVNALASNLGDINTALGYATLLNNTTGSENTAVGVTALWANTTGNQNTGIGVNALNSNTTGAGNTAVGDASLISNTTGSFNTAIGLAALNGNTTGIYNTANGVNALQSNTTGGGNTATGFPALSANTTGSYNSAYGFATLMQNTTGGYNTASGVNALQSNTTGSTNIAVGYGALANNSTGGGNIAIGTNAGENLTTGDNNIDFANAGATGESGTIRIGTTGQQVRTFIAGICGHSLGRGAAVLINSSGQLFVEESSERYKTDIAPGAASSERLQQLRPVTYRFKADSTGDRHYRLIAEEVDKVYPDLVIRDEAGRVEGVRYDELAPILVGEIQQQQRQIEALGPLRGSHSEVHTQLAVALSVTGATTARPQGHGSRSLA